MSELSPLAPRQIGYAEAEALCGALAEELRRHLAADLEGWTFRAIPRGGLIVLGMLSYLLGLRREQVEAAGEGGSARVVVVDDCALSGARFGSFLSRLSAREVVFVHLASHPELRRAIVRAEPRVGVCLAAVDLAERAGAPPWRDAGFWDPWRARLPGRRYWLGAVQPVAFAWSAPEVVFADGDVLLDDGWHRDSPLASLRGRVAAGVPEATGGSGVESGLDLPPAVLWKLDRGALLLRSEGRLYRLAGTGLEMWRALLAFGLSERAIDHLAARYRADRASLAADLVAFAERLVAEGLLQPGPGVAAG